MRGFHLFLVNQDLSTDLIVLNNLDYGVDNTLINVETKKTYLLRIVNQQLKKGK
jgi:hypothetical protein